MLSLFFFIDRLCRLIPANPQTRTRDTPSRLALLAHNFFFLSFLNKHYFYNQVTSVFIPWLGGTRPGYKFELNFTLALLALS